MMDVSIRKCLPNDAPTIAKIINNKAVQDNLRDGMPYPYSEEDGVEFIASMTEADQNSTFAFAITLNGEVVGSIGAFGR
jgi:RimJ/RimL family protein N-acetyltransferase